jgi:hypothetical protein
MSVNVKVYGPYLRIFIERINEDNDALPRVFPTPAESILWAPSGLSFS